MDKYKIELDAAINEATAKKKINNEIKNIQKNLNEIELKTSVDQSQVKNDGKQIGQLLTNEIKKNITSASLNELSRYFQVDASAFSELRKEMSNLIQEWAISTGKSADYKTAKNADANTPNVTKDQANPYLDYLQKIDNEKKDRYSFMPDLSNQGEDQFKWITEDIMEILKLSRSDDGLARANQNGAESLTAQNNVLDQTTISSGTESIAAKGLSIVGGSIASIVIDKIVSVVASGISDMIHAQEIAFEKAKVGAQLYADSSASIQDYTKSYEDLHQALINARGNREETKSIKEQLLSLQQELNNAFGDEYGTLALINDAYRDQTDAIKSYHEQSAKKLLNKDRNGLEVAEKKMLSDNTYSLGAMSGFFPADELDILNKIKEIASDNEIEFTRTGFEFSGSAQEAETAIYSFMNSLKELQNNSMETSDDLNRIFDGLLDNSSEALTKAENIIAEYGNTHRQKQLAEIASSPNLSSDYDRITTAIDNYNNAILESEDPYNDDYVKQAYDYLQNIRNEISDSSDWKNYKNIINETFSQVNDATYSFYNAIQNNEHGLKGLADSLDGLSETNLRSMIDDGNNGDAFDKLCLKAKSFGLEVDDVIYLLTKMGITLVDSKNEMNNFIPSLSASDTITKLNDLKYQLSNLDTPIAFLINGSKIDLSGLNALGDSLKDLDGVNLDTVNESLLQLSDATNITEAQSSINDLCDEYIRCSGILDTLNDSNADLITTGLESMGISNAQEMVDSKIAAQKYALAHGYESLTNITWGEIAALINEDNIDSGTSNYLANLALSKFNINNTPINTDADVSNIIALANAAGASAEYVNALRLALMNLQNAETRQENAKKLPTAGITSAMTGAMANADVTVAEQEVKDALTAANNNIKSNRLNPSDFYSIYAGNVTPNNAPNAIGGGSGSSPAAAEIIKESFYEVFDWMERKINLLEHIAKKAIGHVVDSLQYASDGKYVDKTFKKINDQMSQNAHMIKRYQQSANDVGLSPEWKKLVAEGGDIDYSEITDEQLSKNIKTYEEWYKKSLDCKEANEALKDSIKDVADAFANAPIDKAAKKLEKYESTAALLDAKVENAVSAKDKNKLINDKSKNITSTLAADKKAYDDSASNVSKYSKNITGQKAAKGATKKQKDTYSNLLKKVKAAVNSSKKIDDKTLNAIYDYCTSVKSYTWYENCLAYNASIDARASAKETYDLYAETSKSDKAALIKEKFDNVSAEYENKIGLIDNSMQSLENQKAIVEAKGQMLDAGYYETQKNINAEMLGQYQAEKSSLESLLPTIQAGTDDWYDAKNQIQECADAISECEKNTLEYNNAINELNVEMFEKAAGQINRIISEQEFLAKLMSHEKQFDENGSLTEYGLATLGTYTTSYYASVENANRDKAELDKLKQMLASNNLGTFNSTDQLKARIDELYSTWQDDISETYSSQESIFDMMSEKFDAELDAVKELIDAKKEALNTEKDLYEYQNQIAEKTKSITTLQKQIAAYKGDTSQEGSAKLQKLQVSLQNAQKDLKDTEYEKYLSDQEDMLDKLYTDYAESIQKRLEDFQGVVASGLLTANENSSSILGLLGKVSGENGYKMQYNAEGQTSLQGYVSQITNAITSEQTPDISSAHNTGLEQPKQLQPLPPTLELENSRNNTSFDKGNLFTEDPKAIKAEKYIKDHLTKAENKKSEYSDLNQGFYSKYSGKILSSEELRELAKIVGVEYNGASKSSNLYKKLHDLNIAGFSTGGIVREMRGKVQENGDSLLASFRPNETVLTEEFTKLLPNTVDLMKDFIDIEPHNYSARVPNRNVSNASVSDVQFNFELSGCQNAADVLAEIKSNSKVQRAIQAVTIDQMLGKSRLSVNSIK